MSFDSPLRAAAQITRKRLRLTHTAILTLISAVSQTRANRSCRASRVPGYGACNNIGGSSCGFCTFR